MDRWVCAVFQAALDFQIIEEKLGTKPDLGAMGRDDSARVVVDGVVIRGGAGLSPGG